jgi:hypothetical protein
VEWLKVKALSSSPCTAKKKKKIKEIQIEKLEKPSCEGRAQKRGKGKKKIV